MLAKFEWEKSRIVKSLSLEMVPSHKHLLPRFPFEWFQLEGFQNKKPILPWLPMGMFRVSTLPDSSRAIL